MRNPDAPRLSDAPCPCNTAQKCAGTGTKAYLQGDTLPMPLAPQTVPKGASLARMVNPYGNPRSIPAHRAVCPHRLRALFSRLPEMPAADTPLARVVPGLPTGDRVGRELKKGPGPPGPGPFESASVALGFPEMGLPTSRHYGALEVPTRTPPPLDCHINRPLDHLLTLGVISTRRVPTHPA